MNEYKHSMKWLTKMVEFVIGKVCELADLLEIKINFFRFPFNSNRTISGLLNYMLLISMNSFSCCTKFTI